MSAVRLIRPMDDLTDQDLMRELAAGHEEALAPLHHRYAALIFNVAAQSLDRAAAEEIVQDVFVAAWKRAKTYDPARGPVRPWLLQIAHLRVLNELRRRGRRPTEVPDPKGSLLGGIPAEDAQPDEAAWREYRRAAIQGAVAALPAPQRQALSLAYFDDLTHEQIATFLTVPLGTVKTRIRSGMQKLRVALVLVVVLAVALAGVLGGLVLRNRQQADDLARRDAALGMVTESSVTSVRLVNQLGVSPATHGVYRTSPKSELAVLTLEHFAPAPAGKVYQVWGRYGGNWVSLGIAHLDKTGYTLMILDNHDRGAPQALQVTLEPTGGSDTPTGHVIVAWSGP